VTSWMKANGWQVVVTAVGVLLLIGEWRGQSRATVEDVRRLDERLRAVETWTEGYRTKLDAVYLVRDVAIAQNDAILQRLVAIETELREVRKALR
jgi:hypothetical protein